MVNAQTWLENIPNWKTAKVIYGTKDHLKQQVLGGANIQELDGDLTIDGLGDLEELNLVKTGKLDNVTISNCPNLKIINLGDSGVKHLKLGPGLEGLLRLDISISSFTTDSSRKLNELDLSHVSNLKVLKCHGELTTKLIGFEKLVQLQHFDTNIDLEAKNVILIPTKEFSKWKENLDIITGPGGLDLLKGGLGPDKDDVDPIKLNKLKNKPDIPITKEQWDNDYSTRPTKKEVNQLINIIEKQNHAIEEFGDKLDDYRPEFRVKWKAEIVDVSKLRN